MARRPRDKYLARNLRFVESGVCIPNVLCHKDYKSAEHLVGRANDLSVDKPPVSILLSSKLRERKIRRDVVIDVIPLLWSRDFPLSFPGRRYIQAVV